MDVYEESQIVIDAIIECCARNGISAGALTCALLQMTATTMKTAGAFEHGLNDEDGVCILHVRLYE